MGSVNLENLAIILHEPKLSENIGTAVRAASNMGIQRMIVVNPHQYDENVIVSAATKLGQPLARSIEVYDGLPEALADFGFVVGATARLGTDRGPFLTPKTLALKLMDITQTNKVGLLFGTERSGLSTYDLGFCQAVVKIPTISEDRKSLNLAQAVLIICYELLTARTDVEPIPAMQMAEMDQLLPMYDELKKALVDIGYLPKDNTDHWLMNFKRIFNRTGLTEVEVGLFRGVCRQIGWVLKNGPPKDR